MFKKLVFAIIAIVLLLMGGVFLFAKDIEVRVSEVEAQSAINDFLTSNDSQTMGVKVTPKYISIDFKDGDKAQIKSEMVLDGHGYTGEFNGKFSTGLAYRIPRLYLDELELIDGGFFADEDIQSELSELKSAAVNVLQRKRNSREKKNSKHSSNQTSEELVEEVIISATKRLFEDIPIYDLRRSVSAGTFVSLALKDVRFTEDEAIVTLSPITALLRIIAAIGTLCLLIVWFFGPLILEVFLSRFTDEN